MSQLLNDEELENKIDSLLKYHEKAIRDDIANHISGDKIRDSYITLVDSRSQFKNFVKSQKIAHGEIERERYLESVLRVRAKDTPDMTVKELYEGTFKQKHDLRGANNV